MKKFIKLSLFALFLLVFMIHWFISTPMNTHTYVKNNHKIIVIEMIHIGTNTFYKNIQKKYDNSQHIVFYEGVTDKKKLIKSDSALMQIQSYGNYLTTCKQPEVEELFPKSMKVHADIDLSQFSQKALDLVNLTPNNDDQELAIKELINQRNNHAMTLVLNHKDKTKPFILPWGALHYESDPEQDIVGFDQILTKNGYNKIDTKTTYYNNIFIVFMEKIRILNTSFKSCRTWI